MAIFAVIALGDPASLESKIKEGFPDDHYAIEGGGKWLIAANGATAANVAHKLGMTREGHILGLVVNVAGYNGLAPGDIWEWIRAKTSA